MGGGTIRMNADGVAGIQIAAAAERLGFYGGGPSALQTADAVAAAAPGAYTQLWGASVVTLVNGLRQDLLNLGLLAP